MMGNKLNVLKQANSGLRKQIDNRQKLKPTISSILFCATHEFYLQEKILTSGIFYDLLNFRVESVDKLLQKHKSENAINIKYTSPQIQH